MIKLKYSNSRTIVHGEKVLLYYIPDFQPWVFTHNELIQLQQNNYKICDGINIYQKVGLAAHYFCKVNKDWRLASTSYFKEGNISTFQKVYIVEHPIE